MNFFAFGLLGLQLRLALARFGWINTAASLLLIAALCTWWWGIAYLQAQTNAPLEDLKAAQAQLLSQDHNAAEGAQSPLEQRLAAFHHVLGDIRYAEQQIKTLFAVADKTDLQLSQAEYKATFDRNSGVTTYQVLLPVKGSYEAIRQFCEQTLLSIQFASLDEVSFRRDAISDPTTEAKLRFTLYMGDSQPSTPHALADTVKGRQP